MWLLYAAGSAFFAGITSILAKCGIRNTDSTVATAVRTVIVLIFSWIMVLAAGSWDQLGSISGYTLLFLILSGAATGASWLCYFRALQIGDINKVVPVDKSSTVLTILLALIFLGEGISLPKAAAVLVIAAGIFLMIEKKDAKGETAEGSGTYSWFLYAAGSAFFASLTSILGKIGISGVESNLGTAIRTCVVLVMAWLMVAIQKKGGEVQNISRRELGFICLSGVATGASWLCYYRALQDGPASVVAPVDKLSVLVTVVFSYFVFGEKLSRRAAAGLALLTVGTAAMALL
ncbi:MAG TPA: EamA family transporter [Candidatus Merdisoma faecalis]|nr:EamA family transporter [uncultured Anaerostipes sp.]HIR98542.1 EamA family transporter [Candidatus Merdisoma faecalis]